MSLDPAAFPCHRLARMSDLAHTSGIAIPLAARHRGSAAATFAIISHPDAGKTTLTEKLLLFGGAINLAGQVKAKASGATRAPTG